MIPGHVLSSQVISGYYLSPDNNDVSPVVDFELGGIGLNDITSGRDYQVWQARLHYEAGSAVGGIYLSAPNIEEFLWYNLKGITEFSFTFDQNMNPFLTYVQNGQAKYYWWDPTIPGYTVASLPVDARSPKCCMDDKRYMETSTSDIVLAYMRGTTLYYREQRDRFTIEYTLKTGLTGDVLLVGMTRVNRLQFAIGAQEFPATTYGYRYAKGFRRRIAVGGHARQICGVNYGY